MNSRKVLGGNCVFHWSVVCNHKRSPSFLRFGPVRVALPKSKTQVHATMLQLEHYYSGPCRQEVAPRPREHPANVPQHTVMTWTCVLCLCDRFRCTPCWSQTSWATVWRGSISTTLLLPTPETALLYPAWRTSQVKKRYQLPQHLFEGVLHKERADSFNTASPSCFSVASLAPFPLPPPPFLW